MESKGIPLRRQSRDDSNERAATIAKCIICQTQTDQTTTTSQRGCKRVAEAAEIRNDSVCKRLKDVIGQEFVYHVTNECYKSYTHKKTLEALRNLPCANIATSSCSTIDEMDISVAATRSQSSSSNRDPPSSGVDMYKQSCTICGAIKHHGSYEKFRISESHRAEQFLQATSFFQDDVYTRTCDLQDTCGVFGADLYCHRDCINAYLKRFSREASKDNSAQQDAQNYTKIKVVEQVMNEMLLGLRRGDGYALSDIRDRVNALSSTDKHVTNRELKILLCAKYGDTLRFSVPIEANKSVMIYMAVSAEAMADTIRSTDPVKVCAEILRDVLMQVDFGLNDKFCDASDLEASWKSTAIPEDVQKFFCVLFNVQNMDSPTEDDIDTHELEHDNHPKHRRMMSLFQILYFIVHNGRRRTPLHIMTGQAIHEICKSSTLIKSLNQFGLSVSYDEILRYHRDMASLTVERSKDNVPLPSHFDRHTYTTAAFDNFDHEEATLSGIGGSHDTVSVLYQSKQPRNLSKPNISDSGVTHGAKVFNTQLTCQKLAEFIKPAKKPVLPDNYIVQKEQFVMDHTLYAHIELLDVAHSLSRLDMSALDKNIIKPICEIQTMPLWSAFNSLITTELIEEQTVGFLPVIPHPATEYATVFTAMNNFLDVLSQLDQQFLAITCDEGVYHIAREIKMLEMDKFDKLVICLGSFHKTKIVLNCLGKYLKGSGAETIWTESLVFGPNVAASVLTGHNYARSLKGMMLLSETLERLRWHQFFQHNGVEKYTAELQVLQKLKRSITNKDRVESRKLLTDFKEISTPMLADFKDYVAEGRTQNENFAYWDNFIQMVSLLKDLLRADREGNWNLHLHTVQRILPLFAIFDCTNYLRWCSLYLEDMRRLPDTAPEVHEQFLAGKFVVKRTSASFSAVGADMCLEQTINRSQKSSSGIIGSTHKKLYVAEWELIYPKEQFWYHWKHAQEAVCCRMGTNLP